MPFSNEQKHLFPKHEYKQGIIASPRLNTCQDETQQRPRRQSSTLCSGFTTWLLGSRSCFAVPSLLSSKGRQFCPLGAMDHQLWGHGKCCCEGCCSRGFCCAHVMLLCCTGPWELNGSPFSQKQHAALAAGLASGFVVLSTL